MYSFYIPVLRSVTSQMMQPLSVKLQYWCYQSSSWASERELLMLYSRHVHAYHRTVLITQYNIRKKSPCTYCRRRGSGGIAPLILTSAKGVGECQLHFSAVLTPSKRPCYLQNRRLPGHQSTYGPFRQEKKLCTLSKTV